MTHDGMTHNFISKSSPSHPNRTERALCPRGADKSPFTTHFSMNARKRILVIARYYHPEEMEGIASFAREAGWSARFCIVSREGLPESTDYDGVIIIHTYRTPEMTAFIDGLTCPGVTVGRHYWPGEKEMQRVGIDVSAMGRFGAEYLVAGGHRNLAYVGFGKDWEKEAPAFIAFSNVVNKSARNQVKVNWNSLKEDLKKAPKPLGLMAPDDEWAVKIYHACEELGLQVPEEVAILGTSNIRLICELNYVRLSSLDARTDLCGYKAAQMLDRILNGEAPPSEPTLIIPGQVIVRESTSAPPITDLRIARAVKTIMNEFSKPLDLDQLAAESDLCRWSMDVAFKKEMEMTMSAYLMECRMKEAEKLLKTTDYRVNEIGRRVGYVNHVSFLRAFQRRQHCSPSAFRGH